MFCIYCGSEVVAGTERCPGCGQPAWGGDRAPNVSSAVTARRAERAEATVVKQAALAHAAQYGPFTTQHLDQALAELKRLEDEFESLRSKEEQERFRRQLLLEQRQIDLLIHCRLVKNCLSIIELLLIQKEFSGGKPDKKYGKTIWQQYVGRRAPGVLVDKAQDSYSSPWLGSIDTKPMVAHIVDNLTGLVDWFEEELLVLLLETGRRGGYKLSTKEFRAAAFDIPAERLRRVVDRVTYPE